MKKRIISFLLVLCMVAAMLPFSALAAGTGTLDNPWVSNSVRVYRDESTLYVYGTGSMLDYANSQSVPWYSVSGNIQRIVIESSVSRLGANAFAACGSLKTISLKRDLTMGATLNMASSALPTGANVELEISGSSYMLDYDSNQPWANLKTRLTKVTVDEGVMSIGAQAFSGCTKLTSVVIPGSAQYIGKEAFAGCVSLTDVKLIHDFSCNAASGIPFTIGNDAFPSGNRGFNLALEISGNGAIPDYASADAQPWANYRGYLTELVIGGDVPRIGNNAFNSCEKLKNISIYFNEHGFAAQKTFGSDTFKYAANKTLNVIGVSEDYAFKAWNGATFVNKNVENTVVYYNAMGMTVTAQWSNVQRGLTLDPKDDVDYGDVEPGYAALTPYQVNIRNSGNVASGQLQVELSGGYPNAFYLSTKVIGSLVPGAVAAFAVIPNTNMPIGDYYTTVIVSDAEATIASFRIAFNVSTKESRAARFVMRLYVNGLGRAAEDVTADELNGYVNMLLLNRTTGSELAAKFFSSDEFRSQGLDNAAFVTRLYNGLLNRTPSAPELNNWVNALNNGMGRNEVFGNFINSIEFKNVCARDTVNVGTVDWRKLDLSNNVPASESAIKFVTRLYKNVLGRDPDEGGLKAWSTELTNNRLTAAEVAAGFFGSQEYRNQRKSNRDFAIDLYHTMMDREPDLPGLENWTTHMSNGMGRSTVFNGFCISPEFNALCAGYGYAAGSIDPSKYDMGSSTDVPRMTDSEATVAVTALYNKLLGRAPDAQGLANNKKGLMEGNTTHALVAASIAASQEFINRKLSNEEFVTAIYAALLGRTPNPAEMVSCVGTLAGATRSYLFSTITDSDEYKVYCNTMGYSWSTIDPKNYVMQLPEPTMVVTEANATAFVTRCYQFALGRGIGGTEADGWKNELMYGNQNAAQVAAGILSSPEAKGRLTDSTGFLQAVYQILFARAADEAGLASWGSALANGATRVQVYTELLKSGEYAAKVKEFGLTAGGIDPNAYNMG